MGRTEDMHLFIYSLRRLTEYHEINKFLLTKENSIFVKHRYFKYTKATEMLLTYLNLCKY